MKFDIHWNVQCRDLIAFDVICLINVSSVWDGDHSWPGDRLRHDRNVRSAVGHRCRSLSYHHYSSEFL